MLAAGPCNAGPNGHGARDYTWPVSEARPGIHRGFRDVDAQARSQDFTAYLQRVAAQMVDEKSAMQDLLEPAVGQRLLDVGCGVGDDVRSLARRVAPTGSVVGVDMSGSMIEAAREAAGVSCTEFHVADAHALPFPDGSFDAARVERTLQHVAEPARVLAEMVRVVRPGGVLTASEPDWGTLAIDSDDREATREVVLAISDGNIRNGWIGRQLAAHFVRLGLESVEIHPVTLVVRSFDMATDVFGFADVAGGEWLERMHERDSSGTFFASVTGFTVKARRAGAGT